MSELGTALSRVPFVTRPVVVAIGIVPYGHARSGIMVPIDNRVPDLQLMSATRLHDLRKEPR